MAALRLEEIWIYPVKGMGGIRLKSSRILEKGLPFDRRWMLIDQNNRFLSQREQAILALFKVEWSAHNFKISFKGESIQLDSESDPIPESINAVIWDDTVSVLEVNRETSEWISSRMGLDCRLVKFPEGNLRRVDPRYSLQNENVSLADAYPYLVIGNSSLDELNRRMENPLPMNRFRPNFVFSGGIPFEEDDWHEFRIGVNRFAAVKPCARCVVPTINQDTAQKGVEPLLALSRFRKWEAKVLFGQNVIAIDHEEVFEGDEITKIQ